jgi:hypothetical protein
MTLRAKLKTGLKSLVAYILYYTGTIYILENILLRDRCVVLAYHRIITSGEENAIQDGIYVCVEVFESHVQSLKKKFNFISLDEISGSPVLLLLMMAGAIIIEMHCQFLKNTMSQLRYSFQRTT